MWQAGGLVAAGKHIPSVKDIPLQRSGRCLCVLGVLKERER